MKRPTEHQITFSIDELESIIRKMHEHRQCNRTEGSTVILDLDYDSDWRTLRIADHPDNAYQHNAYAECYGIVFTV